MRKTLRVVGVAVAMLVLASASQSALALKRGHDLKKHRRNGDYWIGCIADAPAMTQGEAFIGKFAMEKIEGRPCSVKKQKRLLLFFHRAVTVNKIDYR